jgi:hypothetical protein
MNATSNEQFLQLIQNTFETAFDEPQFVRFIQELLPNATPRKKDDRIAISSQFTDVIKSCKRLYKYEYTLAGVDEVLDVLIVKVRHQKSVEQARSAQRNFVARYLDGGRNYPKDAALVAFIAEDEDGKISPHWRFSLITMDYARDAETNKIKKELTPAKRSSFLVGEGEHSHTAQKQLLECLQFSLKNDITKKELLTAFNIEKVSKEFFEKYKKLYEALYEELERLQSTDAKIKADFEKHHIHLADFAKKTLGQLVFLQFLQKKGWLGVKQGEEWGKGDKNFLQNLFNKQYKTYDNFFNDIVEPLFYEALNTDRGKEAWFETTQCRIPFLNGGLFEPLQEYKWRDTDITIDNAIFKEIFDTFNLYNFTVKEDEPLEKEVAVDPEMLGKVFEELLEVKDRKSKGAFYTPREIVHYMCQESLIQYLHTQVEATPLEDLRTFVELAGGNYKKKHEKEDPLPQSIKTHAPALDAALATITVCDPAIGSGAFPVGMLHELVRARIALTEHLEPSPKRTPYELKRHAIENCIYGVDIDAGAIEIAKLRFWLALVVDQELEANLDINPLPNMDYKLMAGDSLGGLDGVPISLERMERLNKLQEKLFSCTDIDKKEAMKTEIEENLKYIFDEAEKMNVYEKFDFKLFFHTVFKKNGFDVVIGNPPYVSNKGTTDTQKKKYKQVYGISDDLYNYFFTQGEAILKPKGTLAYITSDTYLTINSKKNIRELLQKNRLVELIKTSNVFENAMVSPAIAIFNKEPMKENYSFIFKDAVNDFNKPKEEMVEIEMFRKAIHQVFFFPHQANRSFYARYNDHLKKLHEKYWLAISTSKQISQSQRLLQPYRDSLKAGDVTLLGCLTEGGQGLATANNGKYVAVRKSTKWAINIVESRPKKLLEAIKKSNISELKHLTSLESVKLHLADLNEAEIAQLFDDLKERYGRDIFGQGYLYKLIEETEIANVETLSEEEKTKGIEETKPYYVPYDKGDKDGNRWYLETPFCIAWTKTNVAFLKNDKKARWQGYDFYFKAGFCWTDVNSTYLKARIKSESVHDVLSMSLFSQCEIPNSYFVFLINSRFISHLVQDFINNTSHFQINDARQLPIIIPSKEQLIQFQSLFDKAVALKHQQFGGSHVEEDILFQLKEVEAEIDVLVYQLYQLTYDDVLVIDPTFAMPRGEYESGLAPTGDLASVKVNATPLFQALGEG